MSSFCAYCNVLFTSFVAEFESREHEDTITPEIPGELQPAKVPLHPKDIVNSKKNIAVRKEQKRKQTKQRSMGATLDYTPLSIVKHEPEFVSRVNQNLKDQQAARRFAKIKALLFSLYVLTFVLYVFEGAMQEKTGWNHSGDERRISCNS